MTLSRRVLALLCLALGGLPAAPALAEVQRVSAEGFAAGQTVSVAASPADTWALLIHPEQWWNPDHTWSGDAANLSLDPRAGGCYCEVLADGGSVEHMRVVHIAPGTLLRLAGALGPLSSESLTGVLNVTLEPGEAGTKLVWVYKVSGMADFSLERIAPVVDTVVSEQFSRLAARANKPAL